MTYRVVVTAAAKQNLRSAYLWAAERAPDTAAKWLARFEAELRSLAHSPQRCSLAPEDSLVVAEIRQYIFGRRQGAYRALFAIVGDEVQILHIRRAVRDWATADELNLNSCPSASPASSPNLGRAGVAEIVFEIGSSL